MRVRIRNSKWDQRHIYQYRMDEFEEFVGDEIALKWLKPSQLAITTGDPKFPFRVIERKYIVSIDNDSYSYAGATVNSTVTETVHRVAGSRGQEYTVTLGAVSRCTCTGFAYRRTCKHITQLAAA